jgi:hypothetical protein
MMHVDDDLVIQPDSARGTSFHVREMRAVVAALVPASSCFFVQVELFSARVDDSRRTGCLYFMMAREGRPHRACDSVLSRNQLRPRLLTQAIIFYMFLRFPKYMIWTKFVSNVPQPPCHPAIAT